MKLKLFDMDFVGFIVIQLVLLLNYALCDLVSICIVVQRLRVGCVVVLKSWKER